MDVRKHTLLIIPIVLLLATGLFLLSSSGQDVPASSEPAGESSESSQDPAELSSTPDESENSADTFEAETLVIDNTTSNESVSVIVETDDSVTADPLSQMIFSVPDTDLTLCWENAVLSEDISAALTNEISLFTEEGYRIGFLLYDLENGMGISYHSTDSFYSASTIKGPYAACIAETYPESIAENEFLFSDIIQLSDNDAYSCLWEIYGTEAFESWTADAGCKTVNSSDLYTDITARDLTLMWVRMYRYFSADTPESDWFSDLYTDTLHSCIAEALSDTYTVYSKAGWIYEDDYYNVQNDAGIVMSGSHPYVLVVLSDAYERMDLLDTLVCTIDDTHTYLVENY